MGHCCDINIAIDVCTKIKPAKFNKAMSGHCSDIVNTAIDVCIHQTSAKLCATIHHRHPSPCHLFPVCLTLKSTEGFW